MRGFYVLEKQREPVFQMTVSKDQPIKFKTISFAFFIINLAFLR